MMNATKAAELRETVRGGGLPGRNENPIKALSDI